MNSMLNIPLTPVNLAEEFLDKDLSTGVRTDEEITKIVSALPTNDLQVFWWVFSTLDYKRAKQWFEASPENSKLIIDALSYADQKKYIHPFLDIVLDKYIKLRK